MTANLQEELNHIVELKSRATRLDNLIQKPASTHNMTVCDFSPKDPLLLRDQ